MTTPIDTSAAAVDRMLTRMDVEMIEYSLCDDAKAFIRALAAERDAAVKLLRDVGTDGRFSLSAVNSDEADAWYDERDAILAGVRT